ncbi:hypothetical protein FQA39_LY10429 [Lamprigera yunnana]|nr:hypothetical protein FQA39_LY10429 [Lamprigera yunnana]
MISELDKDEEFGQGQIKSKCTSCGPKQTVISSTKSSTGNFFKHLRRKHPNGINKLESLKLKLRNDKTQNVKYCNTVVLPSSSKHYVTPFQQCKINKKISTSNVSIKE